MKHWLILLLLFSVVACKKDTIEAGSGTDQQEEEVYYKLIRIENFDVATDDSNPTEAKTTVLFSLMSKTEQPLANAKTVRWDISFSGLYNSFLGGNNNSNQNNPGFEGPGKGGILILARGFDEVINIPADSEFKTGTGLIGTDDSGAFGEGMGWYLYDFGGTFIGNGSDEKKHVAYALGNPLIKADGTLAPIRTIVLRTALGDYAKIKMISCYKDAFTPDKMFKNTPKMYFTFEYVIVPSGSTKFEIR